MKTILIALIFVVSAASQLQSKDVNGFVTEIQDKKIIKLYGTHAERGYAYGYLLANEMYDIFENYLIEIVFNGQTASYQSIKNMMGGYFNFAQKYTDEAEAIVEGIKAAGLSDKFKTLLGADLSVKDIFFGTGIVEFAHLSACSSISSWGESTLNDPTLNGELVITRNLDWSTADVLRRNHIITVHEPSEDDEQNWVSFGICGLIGALSAINESGIAAFHHMSTDDSLLGTPLVNSQELIFLAIRNGIEMKDYNSDGKESTGDVAAAVKDCKVYGCYLIDAVNSIANGDSAIVIESSTLSNDCVRTQDENTKITGRNFVVTNHFRKLSPPPACYRYSNFIEEILLNSEFSLERQWSVSSACAGVNTNLQTIQYVPASGIIRYSTSAGTELAHSSVPSEFNLSELFNITSVEGRISSKKVSSHKIYPNPVKNVAVVSFDLAESAKVEIVINDISGKELYRISEMFAAGNNNINWNAAGVSTGSYICRLNISYTNGHTENDMMTIIVE